jgi:hypothetical protein
MFQGFAMGFRALPCPPHVSYDRLGKENIKKTNRLIGTWQAEPG